jgi:hypothetical protein
LPGEHLPPIEGKLNVALEPATIQATGIVVSLDNQATAEGVSVADRVALRSQYLREWVAACITVVFLVANSAALYLLFRLMTLDQRNLRTHLMDPGDRVVTAQVIMTLLGATTVQVGVIAVIIARFLFPRRP